MPRKVLGRYGRRVLRAMAEVVVPLDRSSPDMEPLIERVDDTLCQFPWIRCLAWRFFLLVFEWLGVLYCGRCRPMSFMNANMRRRYVGFFRHTRWFVTRGVMRSLEVLVFLHYYSLPQVERRLGYLRQFKPAANPPQFPAANLLRDFPSKDVTVEPDVCVIGSGAGGACVAMSMAQAGRSVALVEEGDFFGAQDFGHDAVTMGKMLFREAGSIFTLGYPPMYTLTGRCVGGTTMVNSGTSFRTPAKVFHWWKERFGLTTWSPERLEPYYQQVEELLELELAKEEVQGRSGKVFARGLEKLGGKLQPLLRSAPGCSGSGVCFLGCPTNAKKSLHLSVIPLALQAGARLYARCRAERIKFRRHHVDAVMARFVDPVTGARGPRLAIKPRAVVVSCGTLHTPVLLSRSGIPDVSRQRGRNLSMHPVARVVALMDEEVRGWEGIPQGYYSDVLSDEGIALEGVFLPPAFAAGSVLSFGQEHREVMSNYDRLAMFGMMVADTSRGRVINGPAGHTVVFYNVNRHDLSRIQRGIAYLVEAFFAAGAKKVFTCIYSLPMVTPEQGASTVASLKLRSKDLELQAFHPLGTCRMGADPREAVLDPSGRVYGLDNLFVADGSIFPTPLEVNPQTTIMAAALKIADHINVEHL